MPTWASLYLVLFALVSVGSAIVDRRRGTRLALVVLDLLAMGLLAWFFGGHFVPTLTAALGRAALPLFTATFAYVAVRAHQDIGRMEDDPELSAGGNLVAQHLGILVGVLFLSPAIAFGALVALRGW